jgi:hypothetical protein
MASMRTGSARPVVLVLVLGLGYVVIAALESVTGRLEVGGATLLELATTLNLVHWAVGLLAVGASLASDRAAALVARGAFIVFLALSVAGFAAGGWAGNLLGFAEPVPWAYPILHLVTALYALAGADLVPPLGRG